MKLLLLLPSLTMVNGGGLFGNCGSFSSTCVQENPVSGSEYLALSASDKKARIMDNLLANTNSAPWFSSMKVAGLFTESMCPVMSEVGDELPWERGLTGYGHRDKLIHSVGVVGAVEWKSKGNHPYTGVFTGSENVFIRMSLAKKPDPEKKETAPGIALKFLRNGMDSGNMVSMFSVMGQDSWNFFKNNFTNHIPPVSSTNPLAAKFATATKNIGQVGLSNMAMYGESGVKVDNAVFPYSLNFVPAVNGFSDTYEAPVEEQLMTIPSGSTLYKVYAMDAPSELGGTEAHIADLVMASDLTTSYWGDRRLFFRHQNMADDLSLKPEWDQYLDSNVGIRTCGKLTLLE